jgi:hypothetical protein
MIKFSDETMREAQYKSDCIDNQYRDGIRNSTRAAAAVFGAAANEQANTQGGVVTDHGLVEAAKNLLTDVRKRYPGEELRCQYMRALDAALSGKNGVSRSEPFQVGKR